MESKVCTKCGCKKPMGDFRVKRYGKDGLPRLHTYCKPCEWSSRSEAARERKRERDRERIKTPEYKARYSDLEKRPKRVEWRKNYVRNGSFCAFYVKKYSCCGKIESFRRNTKNAFLDTFCSGCKPKVIRQESIILQNCQECNDVFQSKRPSKRCDNCLRKAVKKAYRKSLKPRGLSNEDHRKRARRHGVPYEPINRLHVFKRDKWTCYICNEKVFISKTYNPKQATLDCVVAMANGGGFLYSNVKTCCMYCNSRKSSSELNTFVKHKQLASMQLTLAI